MSKSTVMSMPRVGLNLDQEMCSGVLTGSGTWGMVLLVMEKRWELCQPEENNLRNDGLVSLTSVHRNVTVWILTKAVSSSTSRHRKGGNLIGNSHTDYQGLLTYDHPHWLFWWDEQHWLRGEMKVSLPGKGKPCWAAGAGAAQIPLCQRSRAAAAAAHQALVALETLHCKETTQGNKEAGDFQLTRGTSVLFRVYQKQKDFMIFLRTASMCIEVWCFWIHLKFIVPLKLFNSAAFFCSPEHWLLLSEMRNW